MQIPQDTTSQFIITTILTIIGLVMSLTAIILSIIFYQRQRSRKAITYDVTSDTIIFTKREIEEIGDEELTNGLEVKFGQRQVAEIRRVVLRIWNSGNLPIKAEEYRTPITFKFGNQAQILKYSVIKDPRNIFEPHPNIPQQAPNPGTVTLNPPLFNQKEWFELRVLLAQSDDSIDDDVRIDGGEPIHRSSRAEFRQIASSIRHTVLLTGVIFGALFLGLSTSSFLKQKITNQYIDIIAVGGLALIWVIRTFIWFRHTWHQRPKKLLSFAWIFLLFVILLLAYILVHSTTFMFWPK